ncbi:MAG TPA: hypothetical protein VNR00_03180, partial [Opitutus sp.]|nr:hypothetical protein [Opitutus sp.]
IPFGVTADWTATLADQTLALNAFLLEARAPNATNPAVRLALLRPTTIDLEKLTVPVASGGAELMRLSFDRLPLGWISRWSGDVAIDGTLAAGVSVLRADAEGKLTFSTQTPWTIDDAGLTVGGRQLAQGRMRFAPRVELAENRVAATLAEFSAEDQSGNRVAGDVELSAEIAERKVTAALTLAASLPALPHSEGTFGALDADIRAKAHNETDKIVVMDELAVQVRSAGRELFAVEAPQPFLFGFSNSGMFTVGTIAPLALRTGEIPLAWLRPWSAGLELEGTLQPAEFVAAAQLTKFQVRPVKPVHVRDLAARWEDRDLVRETEFSFHPGLDLTLICIPLPEFQLALSGTAHVTRGALEIAGRHALDLDAAFSFLGNDRALLPSGIELTTRVELAALRDTPALAGRGLPTHGTIVARVNGDMLGNEPIEFWTRVDGVPAADGSRVLPALEIGAHGKVSLTQSFTADVAVQLETTPRPTEAKFELGLNLREGNLEIASAFRSAFLDAGEALEMLRAFQPRTTEPVKDPDGATPRAEGGSRYAQLGVPFWSTLRGHFDLDIGTLQFAPYRIERVGGRLELRDRELELSHLSGSMFAGRWGGRVRIDYQPENQAGDHALAGEFRIEQFDSARVVQTVFPEELSTLDAKIDVRSTVRSRGNALVELIERTEGEFTAEGSGGVVRLKVPKQELAATAAVFGGTILLSPELRALGRLLKKFAEMPVDQIRLSGQRTATGEVELSELRIDSPQARLSARGRIPAVPGEPLMNRPLELSIDLAARDEMAVILGGMSLIEKKPGADGYRPLRETFVLGGKAGEPDTRPLYDLLAKAVVGSKGTWGFLMRQVQNQVNKLKPAKPGGGKS